MTARLRLLFAFAWLCACPISARAQDAGTSTPASTDAAAPGLIAPVLISTEPPAYPQGATTAAIVQLELTLDAEGRVTHSTITQSAGEVFDDAALTAAAQLRF